MNTFFWVMLEIINVCFRFALFIYFVSRMAETDEYAVTKKRAILLWAFVFLGIMILTEVLWGMGLSYLLHIRIRHLCEPSFRRLLYMIGTGITLESVSILITRRNRVKSKAGDRLGDSDIIFVLLQLMIIGIAGAAVYCYTLESGSFTILMIALTAAIIASLAGVFYYRRLLIAREEEGRLRSRLFTQQETEKRLQEVKDMYASLHMLRHDMKNHLETAARMMESGSGDGAAYLREFEEEIFTLFSTGNAALDANLTVKALRMKQNGIDFRHDLCSLEGTSFDDVKLCGIVGNLLDNAIEGVSRMQYHEDCFVRIQMRYIRHQLFIRCENPFDEKTVKEENGVFLTSKESPAHGRGLGIINRLAEEMGGAFCIERDNGLFSVTVMLPEQQP